MFIFMFFHFVPFQIYSQNARHFSICISAVYPTNKARMNFIQYANLPAFQDASFGYDIFCTNVDLWDPKYAFRKKHTLLSQKNTTLLVMIFSCECYKHVIYLT